MDAVHRTQLKAVWCRVIILLTCALFSCWQQCAGELFILLHAPGKHVERVVPAKSAVCLSSAGLEARPTLAFKHA